ncbi:MAG: superoxide dismutase family protein, partial [Atribacterota bacterium]
MQKHKPLFGFWPGRKRARALINGGPLAPGIRGRVDFVEVPEGTDVIVRVEGLPPYRPAQEGKPPVGPHGFHIHEYGNCEMGDPENPFQAAGGHWNPTDQPHGNHAGDRPVLFSNNGRARMRVFTSKFKPSQVVGRS